MMKVPGIVIVMVLGAASMFAQAAAPAPDAAKPDASQTDMGKMDMDKSEHHGACKHGEMGEMHHGKMCHCRCMKGKDGKMSKGMEGHKNGMCPRMKKDSESEKRS